MKSYFKKKIWRSEKYRTHVRSLPCVICGRKAVAHHMRIDGNAGTSIKPSDAFCLPLCQNHHDKGHNGGFKTLFKETDINVYKELFETIKGYIET